MDERSTILVAVRLSEDDVDLLRGLATMSHLEAEHFAARVMLLGMRVALIQNQKRNGVGAGEVEKLARRVGRLRRLARK